ncbi:MAG: hypothetical protein FWB74_08230 [Defluviitaleaceae bacterium]|nr:hypothetical protein [Defluviitaleaceae bacterium]
MNPIMPKESKEPKEPKNKRESKEKVKIPFSRRLVLIKDKLSESTSLLLFGIFVMLLISFVAVYLFFFRNPYNPELEGLLDILSQGS